MRGFADWLQATALSLGAPGLFVVAFLDSSFLSLPEINDLLVIWMVTRHKELMPLYASAATLGSITGCLMLYYLGRKGGEAFVRRRFSSATVDRGLGLFRRYGVMAVIIPSLLPPPAPFKIFVLLSGVSAISPWRFTAAVAIGRGTRYFAEGWLALRYGDGAIAFLHEHARSVTLGVASACVIGLLGYLAWRRSRARGGR
jgi:membrane protein YqaA with SNARE-associated domain